MPEKIGSKLFWNAPHMLAAQIMRKQEGKYSKLEPF